SFVPAMGTGGTTPVGSGGTGGSPVLSMGTGGSAPAGTGGTVSNGSGGMSAPVVDAGHDAGHTAVPVDGGGAIDAGHDAAASNDASTFAGELDGMFIDAPCDPSTPTPLAQQATCQHPSNMWRIE